METSAKYLHRLTGTTGLSGIKGAENRALGKNRTGLQEERGNWGWYGWDSEINTTASNWTQQPLKRDFFSEFKNNMDYLESDRVMGIQKSSSHPIIWSL